MTGVLIQKTPRGAGSFMSNTATTLAEVVLWCAEFGKGGVVGGDVDTGAEAVKEGVDDAGVFGGEPLGEVMEDDAGLLEGEVEVFCLEAATGGGVVLVFEGGDLFVEGGDFVTGFFCVVDSFVVSFLDALSLSFKFVDGVLVGGR